MFETTSPYRILVERAAREIATEGAISLLTLTLAADAGYEVPTFEADAQEQAPTVQED